jgi:hypothetical protein
VGVIQFKRPEYAAYSFIENDGRTVLQRLFDERGVPDVFWGAVYGLLDIYEGGGLLSIRESLVDLERGFYGLLVPRKGYSPLCPIFRSGPLDEETEITFLAGAQWDDRQKRVRPYGAVGTAEENLEILLDRPYRRRRA